MSLLHCCMEHLAIASMCKLNDSFCPPLLMTTTGVPSRAQRSDQHNNRKRRQPWSVRVPDKECACIATVKWAREPHFHWFHLPRTLPKRLLKLPARSCSSVLCWPAICCACLNSSACSSGGACKQSNSTLNTLGQLQTVDHDTKHKRSVVKLQGHDSIALEHMWQARRRHACRQID
jgi:hypothetical protein